MNVIAPGFLKGIPRRGTPDGQSRPRPRHSWISPIVSTLLLLAWVTGCGQRSGNPEVVVYVALDQVYSEPVLKRFEQETGIRVRAVYDTEATKTVGLVNRILAEAQHPRCDVFWNNEVVRMVVLKRRGLLEAYTSPAAHDIPAMMKDPEGTWTGFAARARVLLHNTNLVAKVDPRISVLSLGDPAWRGKAAMAYPLFGTTATHAAVLSVILGDQGAREFFEGLHRNDIVIYDGNASVRDAVVRGDVAIGWTDTDDAHGALSRGAPVAMVFPDQGPDQSGALVIPNAVALLRNCPNPETGKRLIDYLLSREVEEMLAASGSAQMPVRSGVPTPPEVHRMESIRALAVDWERVADRVESMAQHLGRLFVR